MSVISAGTTTTTAFKVTGDTTGTLQLQTGAVPTTAINISATQVVTFPATTTLDFTGTLLLGDGSAAAPTLAHSGDTNTGIYFPGADQIAITTAGTQRFVVDAIGNIGVGVTPSAWGSTFKAIEFNNGAFYSANTSFGNTYLGSNAFYNGTNWIYKRNESAGYYAIEQANHQWFRAPSGTAGNTISFTQAMTLDAGGRLLIGRTVSDANNYRLQISQSSATYGSGIQLVYEGAGAAAIWENSSGALVFGNDGADGDTERARIDSSGNLGLGVTPSAWASFTGFQFGAVGGLASADFGGSNVQTFFGNNIYYGGSPASFRAIKTNVSSIYRQVGKTHVWGYSESVTANNAITITEAMTLDTNSKLAVNNAVNTSPRFAVQISGSDRAFFDYVDTSGDTRLGSVNSQPLAFYTNNTERARITAAGLLGLGTSSPVTALDFGTSRANAAQIINIYTSGNNRAGIGMDSASAAPRIYAPSADPAVIIGHVSSSDGSTFTERARITSGGNLLVGRTSGSARLAVQGTAASVIFQATDGTNGDFFVDFPSQEITRLTAEYGANGILAFATGTSKTERARITSGGDFLIGTTTASGKLAVFTSNIAGVGAYIRNAVADSNTTDGIQLFENSGQATGRHAISWYNGNQNYYKARIWTQVGNNYDNTRFSIEVANNARTVAERFAIYNGNCEISGNLTIAGSLSKGSGSFRIDHPLKPDTHQLVHSFIEGPQADLIYSGKVQLEDGVATVNIDVASGMTEGTFVVLCRDIRCFTNNETDWDNVRGKVVGNLLTIECQNPDSNAVISWMVIGERQDKHMYDTEWTDADGKVIVEPLKELH